MGGCGRTVFPVTLRSVPWPKVARWAALSVIAAAGAVAVVYLLLWYGPDVLARHDIGNVTGPLRVLRLQQARDAARGRMLTLGAGLFAAAALVYTARNFGLSREGQFTDRYTKAVEQVGSDKLDVRVGGIYALERVARDSAKDHPTVMEVLAAFIREHSHEQWPVPKSAGAPVPDRSTRPDVQAALTVIGRRDARHDRRPIDLTAVNLTGAYLTFANLADARLDDADLTGADLSAVNLTGAYLTRANLTRACLQWATVTRADLTGADLRGLVTSGGLPREWGLPRSDFPRTLRSLNLSSANLEDAKWSKDRPAPEGWVHDPDSGRLKLRQR